MNRRAETTARNGVHLSAASRDHVAVIADRLVAELIDLSKLLDEARVHRGQRSWRRDCMTAEQRSEVARATKRVRRAAQKWIK